MRRIAFAAVCLMLTMIDAADASAQFGGYQQMTLDKIRRQQAADLNRGPAAGGQFVPGGPQGVTRNFFISPYYNYSFNRFYYADAFGYQPWVGMPMYPMMPTPVIVQPQVNIIPPVNPMLMNPGIAANPWAAGRPNAPAGQAAERQVPQGPEAEIVRRVSVLKPSTEAGRTRADRLIADGDREFANQQYRRAASRYREAIARAPDYPDGHFRAGHAYTATKDYELAVTYFAMGYELARTTDRGGFSLEAIYRGNALAKEDHLESLADASLRQPEEGGILFLIGLMLHHDQKPLQARDYFRRAAEMPGRHRPYAAMFLPPPADAP